MSFTFPAGTVTDTSLCDNDKTVKEYRALESSLNLHKHKQKPWPTNIIVDQQGND